MTMPDFLEQFRLDNKTALVTGAASGLGRAITWGMAQSGADVVAADVSLVGLEALQAELMDSGRRITIVEADVSNPDSVKTMLDTTLSLNGRVDVLQHVAGIGARHPADGYPLELWNRVLQVNLTGAFLCVQAVGNVMLDQGSGSIITIASIGGIVGWAGSVGYQASKAGVGQLSRSLGIEWAARGVRVNSIAPGAFDTPAVRAEAAAEPDVVWSDMRLYPMGRFGHDHEIVGASIFLASDASRYLTGQVLVVDGGFTAQ